MEKLFLTGIGLGLCDVSNINFILFYFNNVNIIFNFIKMYLFNEKNTN